MLLPEVCKLEIGCPYACFDQCCYLLCTTVWFVTIKIYQKNKKNKKIMFNDILTNLRNSRSKIKGEGHRGTK